MISENMKITKKRQNKTKPDLRFTPVGLNYRFHDFPCSTYTHIEVKTNQLPTVSYTKHQLQDFK